MSKFYIMGKYTQKALQDFINNPSQDKTVISNELSKKIGATLTSFDIFHNFGITYPNTLQDFINNPSQDKTVIANKLSKKNGSTTLMTFNLVRGQYDFIATIDSPSFESIATIKMSFRASKSIENITILEATKINSNI